MEGLCGSEKEICKNFVQEHRREIQKMMIASATKLIQTSKGVRILLHFNVISNYCNIFFYIIFSLRLV